MDIKSQETIFGLLPKTWKIVKFKDILKLKNDKSTDNSIQMYSITNNGIFPRDEKFNKQLAGKNSKFKLIHKNNLIFGMSREILNWGIMKKDVGGVSSAYTVYEVDSSINIKYLEYFIGNWNKYFKDIIKPASREGQGIEKDMLMTKIMYVPPNEDLTKMFEIIDSINKKIEINNKINNNLEQLTESIFKNWFVKCEPFKNENFIEHSWTNFPESWELIRLKDIIHITSGKRPGDKQDLKNNKFIYPLYGASSIMGYVSEYSYNEPILLIGRVGTLGIVQRVLDKCHPSDNTLVIKSKYYEYIFQILKRINYDAYNTGSTQPLITQKAISNIEIPLPPQKELDKFEKISSTLYSEVYKNKKEIETLTKLRDTLLPKLMSGEIDVSNINFDL